jgi:hypothetical protein
MITFRRIGLAVLAVAAIAVFFVLAPDSSAPELSVLTPDYGNMVQEALSDFDANDARTEGAPQQQVVNGWVARDLLSIIALEQNELVEAARTAHAEPDNRPAALLVIAILAIALWGATSTPVRSEQLAATPPTPETDEAQQPTADNESEPLSE